MLSLKKKKRFSNRFSTLRFCFLVCSTHADLLSRFIHFDETKWYFLFPLLFLAQVFPQFLLSHNIYYVTVCEQCIKLQQITWAEAMDIMEWHLKNNCASVKNWKDGVICDPVIKFTELIEHFSLSASVLLLLPSITFYVIAPLTTGYLELFA